MGFSYVLLGSASSGKFCGQRIYLRTFPNMVLSEPERGVLGQLLFPDALERLVVGLLVDELAGRCILLDPLVKLWVIDL